MTKIECLLKWRDKHEYSSHRNDDGRDGYAKAGFALYIN